MRSLKKQGSYILGCVAICWSMNSYPGAALLKKEHPFSSTINISLARDRNLCLLSLSIMGFSMALGFSLNLDQNDMERVFSA